jgi:hypothetical protein
MYESMTPHASCIRAEIPICSVVKFDFCVCSSSSQEGFLSSASLMMLPFRCSRFFFPGVKSTNMTEQLRVGCLASLLHGDDFKGRARSQQQRADIHPLFSLGSQTHTHDDDEKAMESRAREKQHVQGGRRGKKLLQ